jgi:hypothetical protein
VKAIYLSLPWDYEPVFPNVCGYCRKPSPQSHWGLAVVCGDQGFTRAGRRYVYWVPCCKECRWKFSVRGLSATWLSLSLPLGGCAFVFWMSYVVQGKQEMFSTTALIIAAIVFVVGCVGAAQAYRLCRPPVFADAGELAVVFVFANEDYAADFAAANGLAQH